MMALFQIDYFSNALCKIARANVLIPNDVPPEMRKDNPRFSRMVKTLFLLHGYSGNDRDWLYGSNINALSQKYNLAVVMPLGDNSFYINSKSKGNAYATFVGEELPNYLYNVLGICIAGDTYIGGLSMGGFGAIHTGLLYPDRFNKIVALSSALIIHDISGMKPGDASPVADYDYYEHIFGNLADVKKSRNNPEVLLQEMLDSDKAVPPIYMACGTEDFLIEQNRAFKAFLDSKNIPIMYIESVGAHNWAFWSEYLEPSIQWILGE